MLHYEFRLHAHPITYKTMGTIRFTITKILIFKTIMFSIPTVQVLVMSKILIDRYFWFCRNVTKNVILCYNYYNTNIFYHYFFILIVLVSRISLILLYYVPFLNSGAFQTFSVAVFFYVISYTCTHFYDGVSYGYKCLSLK